MNPAHDMTSTVLPTALSCSNRGLCKVVRVPIDADFVLLVGLGLLVLMLVRRGARLTAAGTAGTMFTLLVLRLRLESATRPTRNAHQQLKAEREAERLLRAERAKLDMSQLSGFCEHSQYVVPDSLDAHARVMLQASRKQSITVGIVGGSTSQGGGCKSGCQKHDKATCGPCYYEWLGAWFKAQNISMQLINGGRGSTGPDHAYLCLDYLWGMATSKQKMDLIPHIDLILIEYATAAPHVSSACLSWHM